MIKTEPLDDEHGVMLLSGAALARCGRLGPNTACDVPYTHPTYTSREWLLTYMGCRRGRTYGTVRFDVRIPSVEPKFP